MLNGEMEVIFQDSVKRFGKKIEYKEYYEEVKRRAGFFVMNPIPLEAQ